MPHAPLEGVLHYLSRSVAPTATDAHLLDRYARQHDESAFELLVWRHSSLVLGVCRRVLRREQDAEDAFQATFLALARKAGSLGKHESVGGWLHRVAYRVALRARACAARQTKREQSASRSPADSSPGPADEAERTDLRRLIDAEVGLLPEKYRAPFVLCHLGGKSNAEAARELGCPVGTLESRLTRARQRLRDRLARQGAAPGASPWSGLAPLAGTEAKTVALVVSTVKAAAGGASAPVAALTQGALKTMAMSKFKAIASLVLVVGVLGGGAGGLTYLLAGNRGHGKSPSQPTPDQKVRLNQLVLALGSDSFATREAASKALERMGEPALSVLREAAKSKDLEVQRRAGKLVEQIERRVVEARTLAPRMVRLKYKDTPLPEAVADFCKKSGHEIVLGDSDGRLKKGKITLDTGLVTFWQALQLFCAKSGLREQGPRDGMRALNDDAPFVPASRRGLRAGGIMAAVPREKAASELNGLIVLVEGRSAVLPLDDRGSVRVGLLSSTHQSGLPGRSLLTLQVSVEPRLRLLRVREVRVGKATDERGRTILQAPREENGPAARPYDEGDGIYDRASLRLETKDRAVKNVKCLAGTLTAEVLTESRPLVVVDLGAAVGKKVKGARGETVCVLQSHLSKGELQVRAEVHLPQGVVADDALIPPTGELQTHVERSNIVPAVYIPPEDYGGPTHGLTLRDGKGNVLRAVVSLEERARSAPPRTRIYRVTCPLGEDVKKPVRLVFSGRMQIAVEVPFRLENVPLVSAAATK